MDKSIIQQLKSIRDDLVRRFHEADVLIASYKASHPARWSALPAYRTARKHSDKWIKQIGALNSTIQYLEPKTP